MHGMCLCISTCVDTTNRSNFSCVILSRFLYFLFLASIDSVFFSKSMPGPFFSMRANMLDLDAHLKILVL